MNESRPRAPKASERQKKELIQYFEENPNALRIINGSSSDNKAKQRIWIELTHKLNALDGALKTTSKWAKYWNDIIMYTKTRAKASVVGEFRCDRPPAEIEQRLLILVGQLTLLKMWQEVWERGNVKQENRESIVPRDQFENNHIESSEMHSQNSSMEDYVTNYTTMEIEQTDVILKDPSPNEIQILDTNRKIENQYSEEVKLNESTDRNDHSNQEQSANNLSFGEPTDESENVKSELLFSDLAVNIRTLGTSFNTIGTALNNIATLLEKYNSK